MGCLGRATWTIQSVCAQISQEGIKFIKVKEWLRSYCPNVYTVTFSLGFEDISFWIGHGLCHSLVSLFIIVHRGQTRKDSSNLFNFLLVIKISVQKMDLLGRFSN